MNTKTVKSLRKWQGKDDTVDNDDSFIKTYRFDYQNDRVEEVDLFKDYNTELKDDMANYAPGVTKVTVAVYNSTGIVVFKDDVSVEGATKMRLIIGTICSYTHVIYDDRMYIEAINDDSSLIFHDGIVNALKTYGFYREDNDRPEEIDNSIKNDFKELLDAHQKYQEEVNHPDRYNKGGMEVWDIMEAYHGKEATQAFDIGCALKYILRYKHKGGLEDIKKAKIYLDHYISLEEDK